MVNEKLKIIYTTQK